MSADHFSDMDVISLHSPVLPFYLLIGSPSKFTLFDVLSTVERNFSRSQL